MKELLLTTAVILGIGAMARAETPEVYQCEIYQTAQGFWLRTDPDCSFAIGATGSASKFPIPGLTKTDKGPPDDDDDDDDEPDDEDDDPEDPGEDDDEDDDHPDDEDDDEGDDESDDEDDEGDKPKKPKKPKGPKPGHGYGDDNHEHSGPPGQD